MNPRITIEIIFIYYKTMVNEQKKLLFHYDKYKHKENLNKNKFASNDSKCTIQQKMTKKLAVSSQFLILIKIEN